MRLGVCAGDPALALPQRRERLVSGAQRLAVAVEHQTPAGRSDRARPERSRSATTARVPGTTQVEPDDELMRFCGRSVPSRTGPAAVIGQVTLPAFLMLKVSGRAAVDRHDDGPAISQHRARRVTRRGRRGAGGTGHLRGDEARGLDGYPPGHGRAEHLAGAQPQPVAAGMQTGRHPVAGECEGERRRSVRRDRGRRTGVGAGVRAAADERVGLAERARRRPSACRWWARRWCRCCAG